MGVCLPVGYQGRVSFNCHTPVRQIADEIVEESGRFGGTIHAVYRDGHRLGTCFLCNGEVETFMPDMQPTCTTVSYVDDSVFRENFERLSEMGATRGRAVIGGSECAYDVTGCHVVGTYPYLRLTDGTPDTPERRIREAENRIRRLYAEMCEAWPVTRS